MSIPLTFSGRVALIAGGGGGIGLNIAHDLLAAGLDVVLADRKPKPDGIDGEYGNTFFLQGDLSDEKFVIELVETARQRFGRVDYLVNTTGVLWFDQDASFATIDLDLWDRVFEINLKSFVLTARHVIPLMLKQGGGAMVHFPLSMPCAGIRIRRMRMPSQRRPSFGFRNRLLCSTPIAIFARMLSLIHI
mgnify:CR=1 FL=1